MSLYVELSWYPKENLTDLPLMEGLVVTPSILGLFLAYCNNEYIVCVGYKELHIMVLAKLNFARWLNDLIMF